MHSVSLDDKYVLPRGRVYLTGIQALVRLPLAQRQRDRAQGLNTGGFISGYRGSPLGGYDQALTQAKSLLEADNIHFVPGVNEDLAATSVWGTQQLKLTPEPQIDGVFGIWYGKGPGVDRTLDVFKHANSAGTDPKGGVLAILGDDHGCQSSTLAHQSEQVLASALMPVVNPATLQEYIDFGLLGFALSRFASVWVGFKAVTETVESSASVFIDPVGFEIHRPADFVMPAAGLGIRWPDPPLAMEARLHGPKLEAVAAFARANRFDWPIWLTRRRRLGIVTTGKAYLDVRQALDMIGIDERRAGELGIAIYKVGLTWPLETQGALAFAEGFDELVVVEEKRAFVEDQLLKALYNKASRPLVVGKQDEAGAVLLPSQGELDPQRVAVVLARRILARVDDSLVRRALDEIESRIRSAPAIPASLARTPFFCAGCPHNSSTRVPEGSRAMAGIGCHGMAGGIPERRTALITHMGGEGAGRIGQAPFTSEPHVFQNMGDGTYYHSGLLAIRAASAAGINITYKILFNDAVAMTGGQPHDGPLSVEDITRQVSAEGARKIFVVSDEPEKYKSPTAFAPGTEIRGRGDLDAVQREVREIAGLTVIIYDQACAAEKRRKRKRGLYPDPPKRVFINARVCEGCGDCSAKSNCVAVKPLETDFGRKRQIDQSDCNKDFSCLEGFCPSFVTVRNGVVRKPAKISAKGEGGLFETIPLPGVPTLAKPYNILITGIGGTGVITVGALLGMAAHIEGKGCSILDSTGLAQKNGSVMSHIRLAPEPDDIHAVRIAEGEADALIACDMLVAASPAALARLSRHRTRAVLNDRVQPTADFVRDTDLDFGTAAVRRTLSQVLGEAADFVDATALATALMGDSIATNLFMLGFAWQNGLIPLGYASIEAAIVLNGVAVEANKRSFAWGRLAAHDREAAMAAALPTRREAAKQEDGLDSLIARRAEDLVRYQDAAYADRYRRIVGMARVAEEQSAVTGFASAVARNLYKLMAIKDEYEVARLYTDGEFLSELERQFEPGFQIEVHLAPPLLSLRDKQTGELKKRRYGPWMMKAFRPLARLRRLRGSWADPFGYTAERRMEQRLLRDYIALIERISGALTAENCAGAIAIAEWPATIRGYGHVKERNLAAALAVLPTLLKAFQEPVIAVAPNEPALVP